ncbi:MAG: prephenate dehydrogenase/arogenate dehydrogenase family protein [Oligoflexus sp.]
MQEDDELELNNLRTQIREIDQQILELTAQRMQCARQVGEYKRRHNLPIKDYKVEKVILERAAEMAKNLGIYQDLAHTLLKTLIEYSVVEQDEIKQVQPTIKGEQAKEFLIVGGFGHMGRWFANFFDSLGHKVSIYDKAVAGENNKFPLVNSLDSQMTQFDYIFLATPMHASNQVLQSLAKLQLNAIVIEISSLKSPIAQGLQAADQAGLKTVCLHPMFGPDAEFLAGRNILFCERETHLAALQEVEQIFSVTSANLIRLPFAMHDRLMNYILGASHLINLLNASLLKDSGIDLSTLENMAGTTFAKQLTVSKNVVRENQDLYFDIQFYNQETDELFKNLQKNIDRYQKAIQANNRSAFKDLMGASRRYFEDK